MTGARQEARMLEAAINTPFDWDAWNAEMDAHKAATSAALEKWNAACIAEEQAHRDLVTDLRVIIGGLA
jgi:hypothetical protein